LKFSFENQLQTKGIKCARDLVTHDILDSKCPELMVHVAVLCDESKQPIQILFPGNCILSIDRIRSQLGNENLVIDDRFHSMPDFPKGTYLRRSPFHEDQGCKTFMDSSLLINKVVHVATISNTVGEWISPAVLLSSFKNAKTCNVTSKGKRSGFILSNSIKGVSKSSPQMVNLQKTAEDLNWNFKPILFDSTKKEILAIINYDNCDIDEIADLINTDYTLYSAFCNFYFNSNKSMRSFSYSTKNMINHLGLDDTMKYLKGISVSDNVVDAEDVNHGFGTEGYKSQAMLSMVMKDLVARIKDKYPEANEQMAENLGRASRYGKVSFSAISGSKNIKEYTEDLRLNPHRFSVEIQELRTGYTEIEVSELMLKVNNFPDEVQDILNNFSSPFYEGRGAFYARIMYISLCYLVEKGHIGKISFSPFHKMHRYLASEMGILDEVIESVNLIKKHEDFLNRMSQRFQEIDKTKIEVDNVDSDYYRFQS
jgi:HD-like signal output (HDOD) protein